jgi:hypothetical protein
MRINLNNHIRIVHMDEKDKYACQVNPVPKLSLKKLGDWL